jgi:hypothetical protein
VRKTVWNSFTCATLCHTCHKCHIFLQFHAISHIVAMHVTESSLRQFLNKIWRVRCVKEAFTKGNNHRHICHKRRHIYFPSLETYICYFQFLAYDGNTFIADFGGYLGLLLGQSIIAFFDLGSDYTWRAIRQSVF